jgi:hypothetical protein
MASITYGADPDMVAGCVVRRLAPPLVTVGVDVGEDFLDLAVLRAKSLAHFRIALHGIENDPPRILAERLSACCPDRGPGWLVLIDSPRWPLDLDCSQGTVGPRYPVPTARALDRALREMLHGSGEHGAIRLSMFPTPEHDYFYRCASSVSCKPHLRSIYCRLFKSIPSEATAIGAVDGSVRGGTFTRFMLAGFLAFRAWEALGVQTIEAYPDLQFRLWNHRLLPKRAGKAALAQRLGINRKLRRMLDVGRSPMTIGLDQADAEVLALTAMAAVGQGNLASLEHPAEGRFLITFNFRRDASQHL